MSCPSQEFEPNKSAYLNTKYLLSHRRFQKYQNSEIPSLNRENNLSHPHVCPGLHCIHITVSGPSSSMFGSAGIRESKVRKIQ